MRDGTGRVSRVLLIGGDSELGRAIATALPLTTDAVIWATTRREPLAAWMSPPAEIRTLRFDALDGMGPGPVLDPIAEDLDVVIVAVGLLGDQGRTEADPSLAREIGLANFAGLLPLTLAVANRLEHQGHGALVVVSSVAGVRTRRANYVYGASKAGLDAFALGLGDRLVGTGVDLLVVRPGFVRGRMTEGLPPAPFATTPEAVGSAVARRLASAPSGVLWVPGILRLLFSVLRILPRRLFRLLPEQ